MKNGTGANDWGPIQRNLKSKKKQCNPRKKRESFSWRGIIHGKRGETKHSRSRKGGKKRLNLNGIERGGV